jgi:cytochrome b pre-mRNA-processing protein 3
LQAEDAAPLAEALRRNLYGTVSPAESDIDGMVAYLRRCAAIVAAQPGAGLAGGKVTFAAAPGVPQ